MFQVRNRFFDLLRVAACSSLFVFALSISLGANAQTWPQKPIQIIVPFAPGGIADIVARLIQPIMHDKLGESVLVVNKPGVSGSLATDYVARSKPDGYTLLLGLAAPQTLNQFIYNVDYDGLKDFVPITLINTNPMVLMVNPALPVNTVKELIDYAKANPGKLNFSGAGGLTTYSGEIFKHMAGIDMMHVRYRGGAPAVTAAVAGEVQVTFANYSDALPWIENKRLRPIALTSAQRFPLTPGIPTIAESGLPGFEVDGWSGLLAPAGTPLEIVNRIADTVQAALKSPSVKKSMASIGAVPGGNSPEEFRLFVVSEMKKWSQFVKTTGIKVQ
jgi:tripartite-type tricarboxylate transporter receptor subunit TctC